MKNKFKIILIALFFIISMNNISFANENKDNTESSTQQYKVSDETSQNYINRQLEKINISKLEEELKDNEIFKNIDLKQFAKDLIKGDAKLTDLINTENIKKLVIALIFTVIIIVLIGGSFFLITNLFMGSISSNNMDRNMYEDYISIIQEIIQSKENEEKLK